MLLTQMKTERWDLIVSGECSACGASAYEQKYYFNKDFDSPDHVKKELQIMCVLFTEEIGGIFTLSLMIMEICSLKQRLRKLMDFYDDIGGALKIKKSCVCRERGASGISGNVLSCVLPWGRCG